MTWLAAIARNHAIDVIRARKPAALDRRRLRSGRCRIPSRKYRRSTKAKEARIDRCMQEFESDKADAVETGLCRRFELSGTGRFLYGAAEHDADLAAAQPAETERVSWSNERQTEGMETAAGTKFSPANMCSASSRARIAARSKRRMAVDRPLCPAMCAAGKPTFPASTTTMTRSARRPNFTTGSSAAVRRPRNRRPAFSQALGFRRFLARSGCRLAVRRRQRCHLSPRGTNLTPHAAGRW